MTNSSSNSRTPEQAGMPDICLGPDELDTVFPFHFIIDGAARIVRAGPTLRRLLPGIDDGRPLNDVFDINTPAVAADFGAIRETGGRLFKLESQALDKLLLKGQMLHLAHAERIVFLGSPWPASNADLVALGLSLKDFAIHDSIPDFVIQMYSLQKSLADAETLAQRLAGLNRQLERRVEERTREVATANKALREANQELQREVAERKAAEERVRHLAHYDHLTGLANRTLLQDRLEHALAARRRDQRLLAVLFIDLDRFKPINDTYGHHIGDALLRTVGERLSAQMRESDTVSRLGGDEFVVVLHEVRDRDSVLQVSEKIASRLAAPYRIGTHDLETTPSIGIAIFPENGNDGDTLIRNADSAMYRAKTTGRNRFRFFVATGDSVAE